eukprot:m.24163 g.24163  ORF g.24163 m.24163 type:complete len:605 (+) comp7581_c0_seq2:273-2087(+)
MNWRAAKRKMCQEVSIATLVVAVLATFYGIVSVGFLKDEELATIFYISEEVPGVAPMRTTENIHSPPSMSFEELSDRVIDLQKRVSAHSKHKASRSLSHFKTKVDLEMIRDRYDSLRKHWQKEIPMVFSELESPEVVPFSYRWMIQNLIEFKDLPRKGSSETPPLHANILKRLQGMILWRKKMSKVVAPRRHPYDVVGQIGLHARGIHNMLSFRGTVVQLLYGIDAITPINLFPEATRFWFVGQEPLGDTEFQFWGGSSMRLRRHYIHQLLTKYAGTSSRYQRLGYTSAKIGIFPAILTTWTVMGYQVESVSIIDSGRFVCHCNETSSEADECEQIPYETKQFLLRTVGPPDESSDHQKSLQVIYTELKYNTSDGSAQRLPSCQFPTELQKKILDFANKWSAPQIAMSLLGAEYELTKESLAVASLRSFISQNVQVMVQDESGLPFVQASAMFRDISLLGDYLGPSSVGPLDPSIVEQKVQPILRHFYASERKANRLWPPPLEANTYETWEWYKCHKESECFAGKNMQVFSQSTSPQFRNNGTFNRGRLVSKFAYKASRPEELSFSIGDVFTLAAWQPDPDAKVWLEVVDAKGDGGLVPRSFMD